jgi:uncharacterized membrane protein
VGFLIAAYLTWTKLRGGTAAFCTAGGGCDIVQASRYALVFGVPTAAWGAAFYVVIGALALAGLTTRRWLAAFVVAVAGVAFSAYLTYVSLVVLDAACLYCLASAVVALALVGALLWIKPAPSPRRAAVRPVRVATLGAIAAVVTVGIGAAYFAADPEVSAPMQAALARHLTQTGAVMYGAFW